MELTDLDIQNMKTRFIELLRDTKREGIVAPIRTKSLYKKKRFRGTHNSGTHSRECGACRIYDS